MCKKNKNTLYLQPQYVQIDMSVSFISCRRKFFSYIFLACVQKKWDWWFLKFWGKVTNPILYYQPLRTCWNIKYEYELNKN